MGGNRVICTKKFLYKKFRVLTHVKVRVHDKSKLYTHIFTLHYNFGFLELNPGEDVSKFTKSTASEKYIDL